MLMILGEIVSNCIMYKDSNQRTKDYLDKFNQDKVIQNLVGTDKPLIFDIGANIGQTIETKRSMGRLYYSFY